MEITNYRTDRNRAIEYLYKLLNLAMARTEKLGIPFKREDYKWVLGIHVICDIADREEYVKTMYHDRPQMLFGVVVEIDYHNPNNVQLWENITDKV